MNKTKNNNSKEIFIEGIPASPGSVIGSAYIHSHDNTVPSSEGIDESEVSDHLEDFDRGHQKLIEKWKKLSKNQNNQTTRDILAAQIEIIRDPELIKRVKTLIKENQRSVQQAITEAFDEYIDLFSKSGSPVVTDRLIDLTDIRDRLIETAEHRTAPEIKTKGDIAVAQELSPREIIELSNRGIKGVIMERGGRTSHAAIIARSVGIPAVTGASNATNVIADQTRICLNGEHGFIYVNPTQTTCEQAKRTASDRQLSKKEKQKLCAHPSQTADGHAFTLRANVEFAEELAHIKRCRAEGIGLLRTEAIYLNHDQFGSREKQQLFYEEVLEETVPHPVTIRLFDVGGDKFINNEISENNPFLGWRGIRMLLDERDLLRKQLTAILAAGGQHPGRVKLLLPMVTMIDEINEVKNELKQCRQKLREKDEPVEQNMPLGIMVETPNVAIQAESFAKEVDFLNVGTNDLTQYLLAVDRGNARISTLYNQLHPVMWQMLHQVIGAAHQHQIKAEICGELASYPVAAACLAGMDIDGLSMNPSDILNVKGLLIKREYGEMKQLAAQALRCDTLNEIEHLFKNWKTKK